MAFAVGTSRHRPRHPHLQMSPRSRRRPLPPSFVLLASSTSFLFVSLFTTLAFASVDMKRAYLSPYLARGTSKHLRRDTDRGTQSACNALCATPYHAPSESCSFSCEAQYAVTRKFVCEVASPLRPRGLCHGNTTPHCQRSLPRSSSLHYPHGTVIFYQN